MDSLSKIPNGMRYYFGAEARLRRAVEDEVMAVFDGWGYEEIAAPTVDYYALFERGMGRGEAHRAFRFTDTDGRMLALRPDVTSSVARAAATLFASRARPLRFSYAASVFRQQPRSRAEWRRQSRQVGCELIGVARLGAEMEVLLIAAEVLDRLGLRADCRVTLSHAGLFNGVAAALSLGDDARERMRQLIDTRDAAELGRFLAGLADASGAAELASRLARLSGKRETLGEARRALSSMTTGGAAVEGVSAALDALEKLWDMLAGLGLADRFEIDLADVSGLDYYTGLVFRVYVAGAGARVGSGGRYDDLAANFGAHEPAIGFVLDLDAISDVLAQRADIRRDGEQPHAVVGDYSVEHTFHEALRRRAAGERIRIKDEG